MKKVLLGLLVIIILSFACKKKVNTHTTKNGNLIVGKWTFVNKIQKSTPTSGTATIDTLTFKDGAYFEFKANNEFSLYADEFFFVIFKDTGTYSIAGNQIYKASIFTGLNDTSTIQSLDSNNLTIYNKDVSTTGFIKETWDNLKK